MHRAINAALMSIAVVGFGLDACSQWYIVEYSTTHSLSGVGFGVAGVSVSSNKLEPEPFNKGLACMRQYSMSRKVLPYVRARAGSFAAGIPLWMIWLPASIAFGWRARVAGRPRTPMTCRRCGYDLRGVPPARSCPECGGEHVCSGT